MTPDTGPWTIHLPRAWRAIANPRGPGYLPRKPHPPFDDASHFADSGLIAWWSPLLHVLMYGCGWPRPDVGIVRWLENGHPAEDARLRLVYDWWGTSIGELLSWSSGQAFTYVLDRAEDVLGTAVRRDPIPSERLSSLHDAYGWEADVWRNGFGNDAMHLHDHVVSPLWESPAGELVVGREPTPSEQGRAVLFVDGYEGWYADLHRQGSMLPTRPGVRSWNVDVVCRPLGWLGTYRRSRESGRWFAGQHRWHELGLP